MLKDAWENFKNSHDLIKLAIARDMTTRPRDLITLPNNKNPLPKPLLEESLMAGLERTSIGGVFVLGAPGGSGKTTYLNKSIIQYQGSTCCNYNKNPVKVIHFVGEAFNGTTLRKKLHVPEGGRLTDFLPQHSWIVIDQFDLAPQEITPEMKTFIVAIAAESRNNRRFSVILAMSNPESIQIVLQLNNMDKISPFLCHPNLFKFSEDEMNEFTENMFPSLTLDQKEKVVFLAKDSCSVGYLKTVCERCPQIDMIYEKSQGNLTKMQAQWNEFTKVYETSLSIGSDQTDRTKEEVVTNHTKYFQIWKK